MKKIVVAILALIYVSSTTGATITMHYCMGKLSSIDFSVKDKCGKCGMKNTSSGCCKDELKTFKVNDNHQQVINSINFVTPVAITNHIHYLPGSGVFFVTIPAENNNSSPPIPGISLCILNSVFRI